MAENEVTLRVEAGKARPKHEASDDDEPADLSGAPLFADLEQSGADKVDHIIVERLGPVREGNLGRFETDVTEEQIFARCGGGKYRLQCRTAKGKPIKSAFLTVEIGGEPIFQSELAQRMYDRQVGGMRRPAEAAGPAAMSPQDIVALLEQTRASADAERERRGDAEEQRHNRELARIKAESDARAAERAAEDDRRRKLEEDRDERRRKDDEERRRRDKQDNDEREERRLKAEELQRERDRQFQLQMAQLAKSSAPTVDPIATLLAGVKLAQGFGGGGGGGGGGDGAPADPVTALVSNLPQTVSELGKMFRGQGGGAAANPNDLIITGELGAKGNRVIAHLRQQGLSPETMLEKAFDLLLTAQGTGTQPAQPPPPPPRRGPGGRPITVTATTATTAAPAQPAQPAAQPAPAPAQPAQPTGTQPAVYPQVPPPAAGPA